MTDWLARQTPGNLIALVAVTGGLLIALVSIVGGLWWNARHADFMARQAETEAELKREMIARGMSADEIVRVLKCSRGDPAEQPSDLGQPAGAKCWT
jgi:hypothetical protein